MKRLAKAAMAATLLLSSTLTPAFAQPYQGPRGDERERHEQDRREEHRYQERREEQRRYEEVERHQEWRRGEAMRHEEWERGRRLDYRGYGLREPPPGYEWREVGGVFILGAIATGIIANILLQPR